ncbi:Symplekin tight junction protein C terminal-domain-containing protein [Cladochytrium replicatum]|nr:Symplekin tight junction protein C terminal-domain-containing protein [Cladochytrium replicatum]
MDPALQQRAAQILTMVASSGAGAIVLEPSVRLALLAELDNVLKASPLMVPWILPLTRATLIADPDAAMREHFVSTVQSVVAEWMPADELKTLVMAESLDILRVVLEDNVVSVKKKAIGALTVILPTAFRILCRPSNEGAKGWALVEMVKQNIRTLWTPPGQGNEGVKLCALRFFQQVALVQTSRNSATPASSSDVSLDLCPTNHPYMNRNVLAVEAAAIVDKLIVSLSTETGMITTAVINDLFPIVRSRPQFLDQAVRALTEWARNPSKHLGAFYVRNIERTIKCFLMATLKLPSSAPLQSGITGTLLSLGAKNHELGSRTRRPEPAPEATGTKRPAQSELPVSDPKRARGEATPTPPAPAIISIDILGQMDVRQIPVPLVTEIIVGTLSSCPQDRWYLGMQTLRHGLGLPPEAPAVAIAPAVNFAPALPTPAFQAPVAVQSPAAPAARSATARDPRRRDPRLAAREQASQVSTPEAMPSTPQPQAATVSLPTVPEPTPMMIDTPMAVAQVPAPVAVPDVTIDAVPDIENGSDGQVTLKPPSALTPALRQQLLKDIVGRILQMESSFQMPVAAPLHADATGSENQPGGKPAAHAIIGAALPPKQSFAAARTAWTLLVSRIMTRAGQPPVVLPEEDEEEGEVSRMGETDPDYLKEALFRFVIDDFRSRQDVAVQWLYEEWLSDHKQSNSAESSTYKVWFHRILERLAGLSSNHEAAADGDHENHGLLDPKDRTFTKFLIDVPEVTQWTVEVVLQRYCEDPERMQLGIFTLRDLINLRPAVRELCLDMLLKFCIYRVKSIRSTAILTAKRWIAPETKTIGDAVESFALEALRALAQPPPPSAASDDVSSPGGGDEDGAEDKRENREDTSEGKHGNNTADSTQWKEDGIVRHCELYFSICSRKPDFLSELFTLFPSYSEMVQRTIRQHIQSLIRSIAGTATPKLLNVIRNFPPGSETLALRLLIIIAEREQPRPAKETVALVRGMFAARENLDPRFLLPVVACMEKSEILALLPRMVQLLDGTEGKRRLFRELVVRIVSTPPQQQPEANGTASGQSQQQQANTAAAKPTDTNMQPPPIAPAEFLIFLHGLEDTSGLKKAMEATDVCIKLTDIYTQEVMAIVLVQLAEQSSKLPTLFMRTVMLSVQTFKGIAGFVNSRILTVVAQKRVWNMPRLWEGFVKCCQLTSPGSFQVILTLPPPQMQDLFNRAPNLKAQMKDYLISLPPAQRGSRMQAVLTMLEDY